MKTMKDFAAQQLTKQQMNEVKGGVKITSEAMVICRIYDGDRYVGCNFIPAGEDHTPMIKQAAAIGCSLRCTPDF